MAAYDAFLVDLFEYTGKDTLKALSYEDLSRATNKVCKQIYGAKPTEDQKKEQANIKRKVKMEWKKENETEEGVIKTSMYEEKAEDPIEEVREIAAQKYEQEKEDERLDDLIRRDRRERETMTAEKEKANGEIEIGEFDISAKPEEEQAKHEVREAAKASDHAGEAVKESVAEEEQDPELPCDFAGFHFGPLMEQESVIEHLAAENIALKLANGKLCGLIDGLCLGSSIVLSGLLVIMLMYKFI
jgi:hypothetical protein